MKFLSVIFMGQFSQKALMCISFSFLKNNHKSIHKIVILGNIFLSSGTLWIFACGAVYLEGYVAWSRSISLGLHYFEEDYINY